MIWMLAIPLSFVPNNLAASSSNSETNWVPNFDYDQSAPLDLQEVGVRYQGDIAIHDVHFASPVKGRIKAYLVRPVGTGPFPAILYVHWLGDPGTSNRSQFLNEAVTLAKAGILSLLVDGLWSDVAHFPWTGNDFVYDRNQSVRQVIDLRRALDVLIAQPEVDAKRLAFVGHDFGAMAGGELAGVDQRVQSYVLMAGTPRFRYWFFHWSSLSAKAREAYAQGMAPIDPLTWIGKAAPATVFFQFSQNRDNWVPNAQALEYFNAASEPKLIAWYDADHSLNHSKVRTERQAWLRKRLLHSGEFSKSILASPDQARIVTFHAEQGNRYTLQTSEDLSHWQSWTQVVGQGVSMQLADNQAAQFPFRFYRAVRE